MARKAEIIVTDDGQIAVLGSVTEGNTWSLTERKFGVKTLADAQAVATDFLLGPGGFGKVQKRPNAG